MGRSARTSSRGKIMPWCIPRRSPMARYSRIASPNVRRRRYFAVVRPWAAVRGNILARCVPGCLAVAIFRRDAFPGGNPWQFLRSMYPKRGLGREKRPSLARFARHVSEMSWLWQDIRVVYPKSPANRLLGMHRAKILPGRGPFRCTDPLNHARHANLAILCRRTALALAASAPPNDASRPQPRCRPHDTAAFGTRHPARTAPTRPPFRGARASFRHLSPCSPCLYTRTGVRINTSEQTLFSM